MLFRGGGGTGFLEIENEASFHIEYQIKETSDLEKVAQNAFDGTLLLLDGHNVVKEFPLAEFKK